VLLTSFPIVITELDLLSHSQEAAACNEAALKSREEKTSQLIAEHLPVLVETLGVYLQKDFNKQKSIAERLKKEENALEVHQETYEGTDEDTKAELQKHIDISKNVVIKVKNHIQAAMEVQQTLWSPNLDLLSQEARKSVVIKFAQLFDTFPEDCLEAIGEVRLRHLARLFRPSV
jgi:hypothetical protein